MSEALTPRHFDEGVFRKIASELVEVDLSDRRLSYYCVRIAGVDGPDRFGGMCPVIYRNPQELVADYMVPCFCVVPSAPEPDSARMMGVMDGVRVPAAGAQARTITKMDGSTVSGFTAYEDFGISFPFNMTYEVECRAKKRGQDVLMFMHLLRKFPLNRGYVLVQHERDVRSYTVFLEGTSDLTEVADVVNRTPGKSVSVRVEGELDIVSSVVSPSVFAGVETRVFPLVEV